MVEEDNTYADTWWLELANKTGIPIEHNGQQPETTPSAQTAWYAAGGHPHYDCFLKFLK